MSKESDDWMRDVAQGTFAAREAQSNAAPQGQTGEAHPPCTGATSPAGAAPDAGDCTKALDNLMVAYAGRMVEIDSLRQQVAEAKSIALEAQSESAAYHAMMDRAESERDELRAIVSELTMHQSLQDAATAAVMERAEKAERERDALRKDAERYRWLRAHVDSMSIEPPLTVARVSGCGLEGWSGDNLNAAIDAAMQGKEK